MVKHFFNNNLINSTIKDLLDKSRSGLNEITYVYAIMSKKNPFNFAIITNKDEWFKTYIANKCQLTDPIITTAAQRLTPFSWREEATINCGELLASIPDLEANGNIPHGYTFVLHDQYSNLVVLSFIANRDSDADIVQKIADNKAYLQMVLIETHEKTTSFYKTINTESDFYRMNNEDILSERENEIMYWSSVGKSYTEIATLLGLKLTTVKYHMGKVVKKLGVTNVKHAISLVVELKLIQPIDTTHQDKNQ